MGLIMSKHRSEGLIKPPNSPQPSQQELHPPQHGSQQSPQQGSQQTSAQSLVQESQHPVV